MHSTTDRQYLILLSALFFVIAPLHVHTMDTVITETNTSIGNRLMTRLLTYSVYTSDDVATAIRSILQLQQTCKFWFSELDKQNKKEIVEYCFFNGQEIDLNKSLVSSLNEQLNQLLTLKSYRKFSLKKSRIPEFPIPTAPELYLFAGADVNGHNQDGESLMGLAAAIPTKKYLRMFIKKGGNITITDTKQEYPNTRAFRQSKALDPKVQEKEYGNNINVITLPKEMDPDSGYVQELVYLQQGNFYPGKTPYYHALDRRCDENCELINQIIGTLSLVYITEKTYPNTNIPNAREALDFIDKNVDDDGMICCYEDENGTLKHFESDDE